MDGRADFMRSELEQTIARRTAQGMTARQATAMRRDANTALRRLEELEARCPRAEPVS